MHVTWASGDVYERSVGRWSRPVAAEFAVADAAGLPDAVLAEMRRVARPGGTAGVYVRDYAGEMQLIRTFWDAAVELDPAAAALDERRRFGICRPALHGRPCRVHPLVHRPRCPHEARHVHPEGTHAAGRSSEANPRRHVTTP